MSPQDRIVSDLLNALGAIQHAAASGKSVAYIDGIASQAIANVTAQCERNSDGYLVVKGGR